jgi:hypothetical protein
MGSALGEGHGPVPPALLDDDEVPSSALRTPGNIPAGEAEQQRFPRSGSRGARDSTATIGAARHWRTRGNVCRRTGLARNPSWRMRTKRRGKTWSRNRRRKVGASSVASRGALPWARSFHRKVTWPSPQRDEPIVGEGDAIGIATEIGQDLLSTGEGGLAIHDPRFACRLREWATGIPIWSTNLLVVEGVLEQAQQLAAEDLGKDAHGREEVAAGGDPAGVVDGEPPAGDDAVDRRMVEELLGPGVQDGGEADLRAEAPAGDRVECLGCGGEQQAVRHRRRGEEERVQLGRHGEDDVEVRHGEQIALLGLDPARFVQPVALGAVPIAAGVVGELFLPAGRALPAVAAERGRAALGDRLEDAPLLRGQAVEVLRMRAHDSASSQRPRAGWVLTAGAR